jgi:hypothetical protein
MYFEAYFYAIIKLIKEILGVYMILQHIKNAFSSVIDGYVNIFMNVEAPKEIEKKTAEQALSEDWGKISNDMSKSINAVKHKYGV